VSHRIESNKLKESSNNFTEKIYLDIYNFISNIIKNEKISNLDIYNFISNIIKNEKTWNNIVVYFDLKNRGRNPIKGPFPNSFLISKGNDRYKNYLVYIISQNQSISIERLFEVLNFTKRLRIGLILAIVDMYGDITYYTLSEVSLLK
jgi:tRNA-intron endonuclease